jgi:hypothetical protein
MPQRVLFRTLFIASAVLLGTAFCIAQAKPAVRSSPTAAADLQPIRSSPAYAEVLLRKTELQSDVESMLTEFTEEHPKVQEAKYSLEALQYESDRLMSVKPADAGKLTLALGKLIVRKVELKTELWLLLKTYKDEHPDVKRAQRKVEIYEAAIREILG